VYTALPAAASHALAHTGARLVSLPEAGRDKVDLPAVLRDLAQRGVNELHVEAGHKLNASFLRAGLVDELLVYLAPKLMGPGAGMAALGPFTSMDDAQHWFYADVSRVGPDLRLMLRRAADLHENETTATRPTTHTAPA
jgi:diaminohydroxyphosphoribosylaminopyrimidine deaminase/5-amino-6-(5-phosphoribosylamino)uracil reductase